MLLGQAALGAADLDILAAQLAAALDGPLLVQLWATDATDATDATGIERELSPGWADLVHRVCRPLG
jgi:polyketide synthase 12